MKKLIYLIPVFLGLVMTSCYKDEIEDINKRLEQIENTKIASLSEQVGNIKISLAKLEGVDGTLDAAIKGLDNLVSSLKTQLDANASADASTKQDLQKKIADAEALIAQLTIADALLDKKIEDLKTYVDAELSKSKDWAESTFATLTQYYELEAALIALDDLIEQTEEKILNEYTSAIASAIKDSEASMKTWVNKALADDYYDMAAIDAKLLLLEGKITDADAELAKQISNQQAALNQAVAEFSNTVQTGIATAVAEGGVINAEIAEQIKDAMGKVDIKLAVIDNAIAAINTDIAAIRNDIASIQEQINSIKTSVGELQSVDTEVNGYISTLTEQYEALSAAYETLSELINSGAGSGSGSVSNAALEEYKAVVASELDVIKQTLTTLQSSDENLKTQLDELQTFVNDELAENKDWAESTFATLAKFNQLSDVVATIKSQIETLIEQMDVRLATLATKEELNAAISNLSSSVQADIQTAVDNCNTAMQTMQQELTAAYKSAISTAISNSETSLKSWINTKLASYYTAAQTDSKLSALKTNLEGQLSSQYTRLENLISSVEITLDAKIANNSLLITQLEGALETANSQITDLASQIATNTQKISTNAQSIKTNANSISSNASKIATNSQAITAANKLISDNKKMIAENEQLIEENSEAIAVLQNRATVNENAIQANAEAISANAEDIAANADLIAANAAAIVNNAAAISQNAADIQQARADLEQAKKDITEAYQKAIKEAIETSEGKLNAKIAEEVATLNSRITSEVDAINETITALTSRVTACEKDIKTIKTNIYNIQTEIEEIQEQIATILSRIQSFTYVPKYSDGRAAVSYTNNGTITPGNVTLDFNVLPSGTASELAKVWQTAITAEVVYTITRASVDVVPLTVVSVVAEGDYLTMVVSGEKLSDDFYLGRTSANLCVKISDGNNERRTEYISLCPWTTDVIAFADPKFKTYLLENFDANSDGEISENEALDVTEIDCSYMQIISLSGIEYFTNLTSLNASYNRIETLDLRNNSKLTEVDVMNNLLTSLHVEGLSALESLDCSSNKLAELNVTASKGLKLLNCSNNKLGALNVLDNKALVELNCANNNIAQINLKNNVALEMLNVRKNTLSLLDVTKHVALKDLDCSSNSLTSLNVYNNTLLETLRCAKNQLKTLDVRHLASLSVLDCSSNNLSLLDVTRNTALTMLDASENALVSLDLSCNAQLETADCSKNADLTRVWMKDEEHVGQISLKKDDAAIISYNNGGILIPDANLKSYMLALFDDDEDGEISIVEAANVQNVNCSGRGIADITGLESCPNLKYLNFSNNSVVHARLPYLAKLETVVAYGNPLETLNLNNDVALTKLYIINVDTNALSGTTVTVNGFSASNTLAFSFAGTKYTKLNFTNSTTLASYDFTENIQLTKLVASGNRGVKATDVSTLTQLTHLDLHNCDLEALNVDTNLELVYFDCSDNKLTALNVDNNVNMVDFNCSKNSLSTLRISNNTLLEKVQAQNNTLSNLNVRQNKVLKHLNVSDNTAISALALTSNTTLEHLYASRTSLTDIDLVANTAIKTLDLAGVATMDIIDLTKNTALVTLDVSGTSLSVLDLTNNQELLEIYFNDTVEVKSAYQVGKLLTVNGVGGIVYELVNSKNKLLSVDESRAEYRSYLNGPSISTSKLDGRYNTDLIASTQELSKFPAFNWCIQLGSQWYLPAYTELYQIYLNRSILNEILSVQIKDGNYWSSSEYDYNYAYPIEMSTGHTYGWSSSSNYYKNKVMNVRAIRVL